MLTYGDGGGLDRNATFLFVLSSISESSFTSLGASDDSSFAVTQELIYIRELIPIRQNTCRISHTH